MGKHEDKHRRRCRSSPWISSTVADWFRLKANRLVSGEGLSYFDSLGAPLGIVLMGLWLAVLALALVQRSKWSSLGLAVLSAGVLIALVPGSGLAARNLIDGAGEFARISPSGGFWLSALAVYLLYFAVTRQGQPYRIAISIAVPSDFSRRRSFRLAGQFLDDGGI